ncbi:MAG: hypothetical protein Q7R52_02745 [archaeon]|nr:hypothetical protein [archaeon]
MRIAFFQDLNPLEHSGGAQMNDREMIRKGFERHHNIQIITPQNFNLVSLEGTHLVIFSNCLNFSREIIKEVCSKFPYIFFHHDFIFYKFRLFYPMKENDLTGIDKSFWLPIFKNAKLNIWLSPLHREAYLFSFPELKESKYALIPSAIDVKNFKQIEGVERKKGTVIGVNALELFKGRYVVNKYVEEHPELQFTFVGNAAHLEKPNCTYIPYVKNSELIKLYNQHEYFIHLPSNTEPFGRISAEAILCGCKIITNENNGAFSYKWMREGNEKEIRETLKFSSLSFWEEIEENLGWIDKVPSIEDD